MRRLIAGPVEARRGQTARFTARLRRGHDYAYVQVFSSTGEYEPSPHVPAHKMQVKKGQPQMANPTTLRLTRMMRPKAQLELTADEDCRFYLYEEVDVRGEKFSAGKIICYGTRLEKLFASTLGWLRRNP